MSWSAFNTVSPGRICFIPDNKSDNLSRLPKELGCLVLEKLEPHDLCKIACVSKRLNLLSSEDQCWRSIGQRVGYIGSRVKLKILIQQMAISAYLKENGSTLTCPGDKPIEIFNDIEACKLKIKSENGKCSKAVQEKRQQRLEELSQKLNSAFSKSDVFRLSIIYQLYRAELHRDVKLIPKKLIQEMVRRYPVDSQLQPVHPIEIMVSQVEENIKNKQFRRQPFHQLYNLDRLDEGMLSLGITMPKSKQLKFSGDLKNNNYGSAFKVFSIYPLRQRTLLFFLIIRKTYLSKDSLWALEQSVKEELPAFLPILQDVKNGITNQNIFAYLLIEKMLTMTSEEAVAYFKQTFPHTTDEYNVAYFLDKVKIYYPPLYDKIQACLS